MNELKTLALSWYDKLDPAVGSLQLSLSLTWLLFLYTFVCLLLFLADLDKMDSEKDEMNQADIAALHYFYSKHISDLPDDQELTELFAQVKQKNIDQHEKKTDI